MYMVIAIKEEVIFFIARLKKNTAEKYVRNML